MFAECYYLQTATGFAALHENRSRNVFHDHNAISDSEKLLLCGLEHFSSFFFPRHVHIPECFTALYELKRYLLLGLFCCHNLFSLDCIGYGMNSRVTSYLAVLSLIYTVCALLVSSLLILLYACRSHYPIFHL